MKDKIGFATNAVGARRIAYGIFSMCRVEKNCLAPAYLTMTLASTSALIRDGRHSPLATRPLPPEWRSPLATRDTPLAPRRSPLTTRDMPLAPRRSPLATRDTPFAPRRSPLATRDMPLAPRDTPLAPRSSPLMTRLRQNIRPEQIREFSLLLLILVAVLFFGSQIENYYHPRTFNRIATSVAILAVVAVGQTLVVIMRHIDLSVGSIVGFTAYFVGRALVANSEMSPVMAVLLAIAMGAGLGLINGLIIAVGRVPAIITTLGTLAIYRAVLVSGANAESIITSALPTWLVDLPRLNAFTIGELQIRMVVVIAVVVVLLFQMIISFLPWGRRLYAIGSNPDAARMAGLPIERATISAYILCGALCGIGGFLYLARFGTITVVAAQGMELQVVAAVVVGGVNIFGGSGSLIGALFGTILIATLEQSLLRWRIISEFWRDAILGLLILLAVTADAVILNNLRSLWARNEIETLSTPSSASSSSQAAADSEVTHA